MPLNQAITQAPQPSQLFSDVQIPNPADFGAPDAGDIFSDVQIPDLTGASGAPQQPPPPAAPEQSFGENVLTGIGHGLSDTASAIAHPIDSLAGAAQGVSALLSGEGDATAALRSMLSGIQQNPGEALGEFVAGLPLMLLPGGAVARIVGGAAKAKLLEKGASKLVSSAAGLTTGAATGSLGAVSAAGALTNARGEELSPSDAKLAATLGAVFGAGARHADIHDTFHPAAQALRDKYPEAFAAAQDPLSHADRLVHNYAGAESELGQRMGDRMKEVSHSQDLARTKAEEMYTAHEDKVNALDEEQLAKFEAAMKETDERWDIRQQTHKGTLHLTDAELADRGMNAKGIEAYKSVLRGYFEYQKHINALALRRDPEAEVVKPVYGMLPRRWSNPHKVWYVDANTDQLVVKGFDSPRIAKEFANEVGGRFINDPEFLNQPVQQIIDTVSKRDITTDGVLDPVKLRAQLSTAAKSTRSRMSSFTAKRKGRKGYDSLDSSGNLMAALRKDAMAIAKIEHVEPHLHKLDDLAIDADKLNLPVTHALIKSVREQVAGNVQASSVARSVKSAFFHTFLSVFNIVAPAMNLVSAGLLTPAHLLTEMQKQIGSQGLAEVLPAMAATAKGLRSLITKDEKLRRMIEDNEREGATPSIGSVNIGEPTTTNHSRIGSKLQKAARINSYLMRKSEHMAKQLTGVAFREAGIAKGMTGKELTLFVHNGVQRTVGEFNAGMRPLYLVGNGSVAMDALAVATTFQSYVIQKVMADLPMIAHVSRPMAMAYLGSIAVASGAQGIPGVIPTLDYLVETADPDGTLTAAWGKYKVEHNLVFHGVLSEVGAASRAEFSGPFGVGSTFGANPLGVTGTLVNMVSKVHDGMPFTKALLTMIPGDIKNRVGAVQALLNGDGKFTPPTASLHQGTYDITTGDAIGTAITGLAPRSVIEDKEKSGVAFDVGKKLTADRKDLFEVAVNALLDGKLTPALQNDITGRFKVNQRGKSVGRFWKSVRKAAKDRSQAANPHLRGFAGRLTK